MIIFEIVHSVADLLLSVAIFIALLKIGKELNLIRRILRNK